MPDVPKTKFEGAIPILRVSDMNTSVAYYTERLGFRNADWGNEWFTRVDRDGAGIFLCRGSQGNPATWLWIGVEDVRALHAEYTLKGVRLNHPPRNYPWALEMHVQDPDGHILRFGSDPMEDKPYDEWMD